ncbi:MAG: nicotinate (nicotinamide) nucleotide adenylyltransferase [Bacteroidota bacterium]
MKIGLYFGSFNPVHNGHMMIANYLAEYSDLDQIWMVVSPQNPLKPAKGLLQDYHRFHLVELAIGDYQKIKASKIEFDLPKPSYTIHTLTYLKEKFPTYQFALIMGADNLQTFHKWKNYELILEEHALYVYPRNESDGGDLKSHAQVHWVAAPIMEVSSTMIRNAIKEKKDVRFFLPQAVADYIEEMRFYKK